MSSPLNLKAESSLIGIAFLEHIYRQDANNEQLIELRNQLKKNVPENAANPYAALFQEKLAPRTIQNLPSIQLSLNYAVNRTRQPEENIRQAIQQVQSSLGQSAQPNQLQESPQRQQAQPNAQPQAPQQQAQPSRQR
jgi:hypothetical protein